MDGVALGGHAQLFVADPGQGAQVAGFEFVFADHGALGFVDLLLGEGDRHPQDLGAVEQALGVLLQAEDSGAVHRVVGPHAFKGTAPVVQRMAQHVDLGIAPFDHLAIHPDFAVAIRHRRWEYAHRVSLKRGICRNLQKGGFYEADSTAAACAGSGSASSCEGRCKSQLWSLPPLNTHSTVLPEVSAQR